MLSLLKMASALSLVKRSCDSRWLLIGRPMSAVRMRRTTDVQPRRSSTVRSLATSVPSSSPRSKDSSKGRTMLHVRVAHPLPAALLADFEQRIDRRARFALGRNRAAIAHSAAYYSTRGAIAMVAGTGQLG